MRDTRPMNIATVSELTLDQKIGQMLLVGYPAGDAGIDALRRVVERRPMGNLILFSRNMGSPEYLYDRLAGLRSMISERSGVEPLVSLDQEGGIVARIRAGFTPMPGAMAMAAAVAGGGASLSDVEDMVAAAAAELKAVGFDWNLAPVADVNVNRENPVIGVRSFGEDPLAVADLVAAYARGLARAGLAATAKHFPGHGDTNVDSHLGLPSVGADLARLEAVELAPFKRLIAEGVASIMSAHVLFPAVEPDPIPATLSRRVLTGLLRGGLGYDGLIVTDCLEMKAIDGRYDHAAVRAVIAGADVVCVSHTASLQEAAFDEIKAAVLDGTIPESRIDESVARVLAVKSRVRAVRAPALKADALASLLSPDAAALARRMSEASMSILGGSLPSAAGGGLYVDLRPELQTGAEGADGVVLASPTMAASLAAAGSSLEVVEATVDPDEEAIARAVAGVGSGPVFIGIYSMQRHPAQETLVRRVAAACAEKGAPLAFVSMRDPYDAAGLARLGLGGSAVLCAYEYTSLSASAVARVLSGAVAATGSCPVGAI